MEGLASQSRLLFTDIETNVKIKLGSKVETFIQRHTGREQASRLDMVNMIVRTTNESLISSWRYKRIIIIAMLIEWVTIIAISTSTHSC